MPLLTTLLVALFVLLPAGALAQQTPPARWETLFDGSSTGAWRGYGKDAFPGKGWRIDGDALKVEAGGGGGDIVTKTEYGDFDLRFDWKVAPGSNSGVMYRVQEGEPAPWRTGPEYQILDDARHPDGRDPRTSAASLYALYAPEGKTLKPVGEWNSARIVARDGIVEHWLNGVRVVRYELGGPDFKERVAKSKFNDMPRFGKPESGRICLQDHGNDVWYRDIRILDLDAAPDVALFDGGGLDAWTYFLQGGGEMEDVWHVVDDADVLVCQGKPAGYIQTKAQFQDFILRLEWRWPEGQEPGNSGVLLRKTGPDRIWPKCIEAQLHHGDAGDFWNIGGVEMKTDPDRTRGGNTKKMTDAENPAGQWNAYEILCNGGDIELAINGRVVNRAWDAAHIPGHICLQSEGAEIHFRNIHLTPLR